MQPAIQHAHGTTHLNNHMLQNTKEEPITRQNDRSAPAAHMSYLSSPAAATLHGKMQGFMLRLPPKHRHKSHATFMQPAHYVLQHHARSHAATTLSPHRFPKSPFPYRSTLPLAATSKSYHTLFITTSLGHHVPSSPFP